MTNSKLRFRPALSKMKAYVPGEQPQGGKFIKLNTNENPYPPAPAVVEAIRAAADSRLERYPDPVGSSFRRMAAQRLGLPGPEWILCGNGSDEILTILVRGFLSDGDLLRMPTPSYILYRTLAEIQGARCEEISFNADWTLPAAFSSSDGDPRLALLPNPNSPSGTVLSPQAVAEIAAPLPCPLVVDEAYGDFAEENCIELVKQHENILVTRTLSKSYSLAGLRFGFLVAQPHVIAELTKIKDSYNCDAIAIAAATAAMASNDWLTDNRAKILATRERAKGKLRELGFDVLDSAANFLWCTHPDRALKPIYEALKENQVLVRYMDYAGWGDGLRITIGTDAQIDAALVVLARLLQSDA
ncbi:histidinol-phosphate transaminase [Rosistilla oblonga]|uniref:histidinol-phosphate transaminase n=1 Tax=Rosistilla oblonga TaxID=2527990 RepID=UPI0011A23EA0|nr:histidinol-phosphate transaminase [Rosistilla oblonga]